MEFTTEKSINLQNGPNWQSFEKFRTEGGKALEPVKDGKVAILSTKTGQYRILEEHDFQKLLGLARDVERLRGGLRVLLRTVRVAQKHPDAESMSLLMETITMLGSIPELPTRDSFEPLMPEGLEVDLDDEVNLNPDEIERPLG
ncbi:hypothetical protein [Cylindrospermum sp. FACHB-282]|uniref:hypothetical protein n=1 Tax=Cylindrospermum sp. FACHB-282 TaxID=2692794 RepID=UPI001687F131|nr:hypothetical protein [Cylindrospermum sp. FACHB-282]MBD2386691.1 hypothetical protein [Cylindrospermum sp. FACHB-282]